jgi:hypothetical protein
MSGTFVSADSGGGNVADIATAPDPVTWPSGGSAPQPNDIALIAWIMQNTVTPVTTGWTVPTGGSNDLSSGAGRTRIMWKVCTGSESGTISLTNTGPTANRQSAGLVILRGYDTTNPIDQIQFRAETVAGTTHANPSVTLGVADAGVVTVVAERSTTGTSGWTPPSSPFNNERADSDGAATGSGGTIVAVADDGLATSRSSGTVVTPGVWTSTNGFSTANVGTYTISLKPGVTAKSLSDAGSSTEILTVTVAAPVGDAAAGTETITVTVSVAVTETGSAGETLAVTAAIPVADAGTAAESIVASVQASVSDAGSAADTLSVAAPVTVTDGGAAAETLTVTVVATLADAAAAAMALTANASVPLTDAGSASETLDLGSPISIIDVGQAAEAVAVTATASAGDAGAGTAILAVTAAAAMVDAGSAAESIAVDRTAGVTDTGTAAETITVVAVVDLHDTASATDSVTGGSPPAALPDLDGALTVVGRLNMTVQPAGALNGDAGPVGRINGNL